MHPFLLFNWFGLLAAAATIASEQTNLVTSISYPSGSLVRNGSFENNYSDFSFEGWTESVLGSNLTAFRPLPVSDQTKPFNGRRMAAVQFSVPVNLARFLVTDPFPVRPNTWYTFFIRHRNSGYAPNSPETQIRPIFQAFRNRDILNEHLEEVQLGPYRNGTHYPATSEWSLYVHRFLVPEEANHGVISLLWGGTPGLSGTFYFDEVQVVQGCVRSSASDVLTGCPVYDDVPFGKDLRHPDKMGVARRFLDGNNKVVQSLIQDGQRDIVTQTFYDETGRIAKTTLPIGANFETSRHDYIPDIKADGSAGDILTEFYNQPDPSDPIAPRPLDDNLPIHPAQFYPEANGAAFSEITYEPSPLGRVVEESKPGALWKLGSSHTMKTRYYSVAALPNPTDDELTPATNEDGEFFVKEETFVQGQKAREFTDRSGKLVRKSHRIAKSTGAEWLNTDFTYDAGGNLQKSESPPGAMGLRLTTENEYNPINQLVSETTPSTGTTRFLSDALGRSRFSQTEEQRLAGRFFFVRYDVMGRIFRTGEILDGQLFTQANADISDFPCLVDCVVSSSIVAPSLVKLRTLNHYDIDNAQLSCLEGSDVSDQEDLYFLAKSTDGTALSCSNDLINTYENALASAQGLTGEIQIQFLFEPSGSTLVQPKVGTEISLRVGSLDFSIEGVSRETPEGLSSLALFQSCRSRGNVLSGEGSNTLGRLIKTLSCNYELAQALGDVSPREVSKTFKYDKFGNVTSVVQVNRYVQDGPSQVQTTRNVFDVQNRLLKKTACGDALCSPSLSHVENYEYDQLGRMVRIEDKQGNTLVNNHYNYIGQVSGQGLGSDVQTAISKSILTRFDYHLHGQIMNTLSNRADGLFLFSQDLAYENGAIPRFDGNISSSQVSLDRRLSTQVDADYSYRYDDLDRLVGAEFQSAGIDRSSSYQYFDDGRLFGMQREGKAGEYFYGTKGRLAQVTGDLSPDRNMALPNDWGFVFKYDENGNLTTDYSKTEDGQPLEIFYRADNLPYLFIMKVPGLQSGTFVNQELYMTYDEGGTRVSKILYSNDDLISSKNYFGSGKEIREVSGQEPTSLYNLAGVGRVSYSSSNPLGEKEFYLKDHLGSVRQVYNIEDGTMSYATQYFPYGKQYGEVTSPSAGVTEKFTGKELDQDIQLSYFGARYYDGDLGMWISPDPVDQFHSSYAYSPNPINGTDPDGNWFFTDDGGCADDISANVGDYQGMAGSDNHFSYVWNQSGYHAGDAISFLKLEATVLSFVIPIEGLALNVAGRTFANLGSALKSYSGGALSIAGQALTKHPNIIGKAGNIMKGIGAEGVNRLAYRALKNMMEFGTKTVKPTKAFGRVEEYKFSNGLGARFSAETGEFIGFLGRGVQ